jgi:hypothetical protein
MTTYMHCRPYYGTNPSVCPSSFLFFRPGYFTPTNYQNYTTSYHYHDQAPLTPPALPPPITPRRRRRLEDSITTYASNYYATLPRQMPQLPPQPPPPPLPPPRRNCQQPDQCRAYCDLFNLLERPSTPPPPLPPPPINKQRRNYNSHDLNSRRRHQNPTDFENVATKAKNTNDRKCHHQQSCYYKEKKRHDDKLSSTEQYDRSPEETKKMNNIYQRRSANKGFFRRIVRNYLCVPSTVVNGEHSS